jgi:hypothetical protein
MTNKGTARMPVVKPDFHAIKNVSALDAECMEGYRDGRRKDSPEPSSNRHPAYIHGFRNGRDDAGITRRYETAQERRNIWASIEAAFPEDAQINP